LKRNSPPDRKVTLPTPNGEPENASVSSCTWALAVVDSIKPNSIKAQGRTHADLVIVGILHYWASLCRIGSISERKVARWDCTSCAKADGGVGEPRQNKIFAWPAKTLVLLARNATIKVMPTPRFTLRRLLLLVTVCAVLSLVPAVAARGTLWIAGVATAAFAGVVLLVLGVLLYVLVMLAGHLINRTRRE
jgi:hypothetical protein